MLKGLGKSARCLLVTAILIFSFDHNLTPLISQPAFSFPNHSILLDGSKRSDLLPRSATSALQVDFINPITGINSINISYPPGLEKLGSTSGSVESASFIGLTWYSYSFEHATDFCQPPDPFSPHCASIQTYHSVGTQKPDIFVLPAREALENQDSSQHTSEDLHLFFTPPTTANPTIESIIAQVNQVTIVDYVADLSGVRPVEIDGETVTIRSRYSLSEQIHQAAQYLNNFYQDLGLVVTLQNFDFWGVTLSNVIAEIPGSIYPEHVYIISAHYDSLPAGETAPGADDNASGVAGVMMAAKILSQYDFACTLRFVNFAAEEQYLAGSQDYAKQSYCALEDVMAVLNLDMIAWNTPGTSPIMNLHANQQVPGSVELAEFYAGVINLYELDLEPVIYKNGTDRSDHASFWEYNIPAILAIENFSYDFNPYYHTIKDKLENLQDLDYFTNMVKAGVAALAHTGCLIEDGWGEVTGFIRDYETGLPLAGASVSFFNPEWDYIQQATTADNGYFHTSLVAGPYDLVVNAPGYASEYYFDINIGKDRIHMMNLSLDHLYSVTTYLPLLHSEPEKIPAVCR